MGRKALLEVQKNKSDNPQMVAGEELIPFLPVIIVVVAVLDRLVWRPLGLIQFYRGQGLHSTPFVPLVGLLPQLIRDARNGTPFGWVIKTLHKCGRTMVSSIGASARVLTSDPDVAKGILSTSAELYEKPPVMKWLLSDVIGKGLVINEGPDWKCRPSMTAPHGSDVSASSSPAHSTSTPSATWLSFEALTNKPKFNDMVAYAEEAMDEIAKRSTTGPLDVHDAFSEATLRIIARSSLGCTLGFNSDRMRLIRASVGALTKYQNTVLRLFTILPWLRHLPLPSHRRVLEARVALEAVMRAVMAERKESAHGRKDMLQILLDARDESGAGMTEKQVLDEVWITNLRTHIPAGHYFYPCRSRDYVESPFVDNLPSGVKPRVPHTCPQRNHRSVGNENSNV
jgi:hypothetical protein